MGGMDKARIPIREGHVILTSGQHSNHYVDKRLIMARPDLCEPLLDDLANQIGGSATAEFVAAPMSATVVGYGIARRLDLPFVAFDQRKRPKGWMPRVPDWLADLAGFGHALVVDDVWTTGGTLSSLEECLHKDRISVVGMGALVKRGVGHGVDCALLLPLPFWPASECAECAA